MNTIYVSGTFPDIQQEREILQDIVLPRIRAFAKQYGQTINFCDLRLGMDPQETDEEKDTARILQICFDEIDRAEPFFIAVLGDCCGWVPPGPMMETSIAGRPISPEEAADKSALELEILYGAQKAADKENVRFYFRNVKNKILLPFLNTLAPEQHAGTSPEDKKRMKLLKNRIRKQFPEQVRSYPAVWNRNTSKFDQLDAFAEMVFQDLKEMILRNFGPKPASSEYSCQYRQYQHILDCGAFFADKQEDFFAPDSSQKIRKLSAPVMEKQNFLLISGNEYSRDRLFKILCSRYQSQGAKVLPYDCSLSVLSSSTENMMRYYAEILSEQIPGIPVRKNREKEPAAVSSLRQFHSILEAADFTARTPVILAIRNVQQLDEEDIFRWLPSGRRRNIHFLLSADRDFVLPPAYEKLSEVFHFQDTDHFDHSMLIDACLSLFHREMDEQVRHAILEKAAGKPEQYLDFLLQRILTLTPEDLEAVCYSSHMAQKLPEYLMLLIKNAPETMDDMVLWQLALLKEETKKEFPEAALAVLSLLPFGISPKDLRAVLKQESVTCSTLDLLTLCRRLPAVVTVTPEGSYRMTKSPASDVILRTVAPETQKWNTLLEQYMSGICGDGTAQTPDDSTQDFSRNDSDGTAQDLSRNDTNGTAQEPSRNDTDSTAQDLSRNDTNGTAQEPSRNDPDSVSRQLFREQYLTAARKEEKKNALALFLKNTGHDAAHTALIMRQILVRDNGIGWLKENTAALTAQDLGWMTTELYRCFSDRKWTLDSVFALPLLELWKAILPALKQNALTQESEICSYHYFKVLSETGELSCLHGAAEADLYFLEAINVSKENFKKHPNRMWKMTHGIKLTEEEQNRGYAGYTEPAPKTAGGRPAFGFGDEIEDARLEQSWSSEVKTIRAYMASSSPRQKDPQQKGMQKKGRQQKDMQQKDPRPFSDPMALIWPDALAGPKKGSCL